MTQDGCEDSRDIVVEKKRSSRTNMLGEAASRPLSSNAALLRIRSYALSRCRPAVTGVLRPSVRFLHTSPIPRWGGLSSQTFRRGWNTLDRFSRITAPSNITSGGVSDGKQGVELSGSSLSGHGTKEADVRLLQVSIRF